MEQIVTATFENGVFKPDQSLNLAPGSRVRLIVQEIADSWSANAAAREEAMKELEHLWATVHVNSGGEKLTRDQLHERR